MVPGYLIGIRDEKNARILLFLDYIQKFMPVNLNQDIPYVMYKIKEGSDIYRYVAEQRYIQYLEMGETGALRCAGTGFTCGVKALAFDYCTHGRELNCDHLRGKFIEGLHNACNVRDITDLLTIDKVIEKNLGDIICQPIPSALS